MKRRKGFYSISVVAKMFSVHQQTIRMYEKQGLIAPTRSSGNTRLFSEEDVDRLEEVINLTHKMGVNLAGVEIILKLQKKIKRMQDEINKVFDATKENLDEESDLFKNDMKKQAEKLVQIRQDTVSKMRKMPLGIKNSKPHAPSSSTTVPSSRVDRVSGKNKSSPHDQESSEQSDQLEIIDTWQIDYEDK